MESSVKRTQRDYTLAFKLSVVDQVEKGDLTYKQAQARYGIQGRSTRASGGCGWQGAGDVEAVLRHAGEASQRFGAQVAHRP